MQIDLSEIEVVNNREESRFEVVLGDLVAA
jgi:hypothetical protein